MTIEYAQHDRTRRPEAQHGPAPAPHMEQHKPYRTLAVMAVVSFAIMFVLMYAMVDRIGNIFPNLNQAYMAALMAAPMVLLELGLMRHMYRDKRANLATIALSLVVFAFAFLGIRYQLGISNGQFLRSMIPHHAGAILMCERAPVTDAELRQLCGNIISSQRAEIDQMKTILRRS